MTPRDFGPPTRSPRAHFTALQAQAASHPDNPPQRLALLFGSERFGLSNEEVWRAHVCLSIPTAPGYGSLNLAQAVQIMAYEARMAVGDFPVVTRTAAARPADSAAVQGALDHWQQVLQTIGFLNPAAPKKLMPRLNQLLNRACLTDEEIHILRGIARAVADAAPSNPAKR